jgi:RNA polymerase sigma factor (sigma-70 family)
MRVVRAVSEDLDPALLAALQRGDPRAIEAVLEDLLPKIRSWLHRLLGPRADLDDATQEALVGIAGALPQFEGRARLSTLAYRVTVRVAYRWLRDASKRRVRESSVELLAPPADTLDPESRAMFREALKRLYRCLDHLPDKRRVAFVLCDVEGMTAVEAAELEGTNAVTMRSRLMYARREIARRLAHDPYVSRLIDRKWEE